MHADASISEVILSGGDPLLLNDAKISEWFNQLDTIPHLKRVRIHTRMPVVLPSRVTAELCQILESSRFDCSVVLHANHSQELNHEVQDACTLLRHSGVTLLNQSVLLRGVNDTAPQLAELSEMLFNFGVLPYYIHLLDKAAGVAHFDVPETVAISIHNSLKQQLPGYLVPKLVREVAGEHSKTWINTP